MSPQRIVNSTFIQQHIGDIFIEKLQYHGTSISQLAKEMGYSQPYLSGVLSGKQATLKTEKIYEIGIAVWFSPREIYSIIRQAKRAEYRHDFGDDFLKKYDLLQETLLGHGIESEAALKDAIKFFDDLQAKYPKKNATQP